MKENGHHKEMAKKRRSCFAEIKAREQSCHEGERDAVGDSADRDGDDGGGGEASLYGLD